MQREEVELLTRAAKFNVGKFQYYESIKIAIVKLLPKSVALGKFPSQDDLPKRIAQVILQRTNLENELKNKNMGPEALLKKISAMVSKEEVGAWFEIPDPYIDQAFRVSWPARVAMI